VTVRDVLPGLGTATVDGEEGSGRAARRGSRAVVTTDFPAPAIRARSKGAPPLRVAPEPWRLDQPAPCVAACEVKGAGGRISSLHGAPRPSKHGLDRASDAALLGAGIRRLTPHECAVLVGLRDHPYIARTVESHYRQVGNTVVPVMAEVIAQALLEAS
jgi:site-specific DNA-cytosine methylase